MYAECVITRPTNNLTNPRLLTRCKFISKAEIKISILHNYGFYMMTFHLYSHTKHV